eukprot:12874550-Alexandrium_andersonii.AAC.1
MAELTLPSRLFSGISRAVSSWGLRPSSEHSGTWCDEAGRLIYCWEWDDAARQKALHHLRTFWRAAQ